MRRRRSAPEPEPDYKRDPSHMETAVVIGHEMVSEGRPMHEMDGQQTHEMEAKAPIQVPYELPGSR
jgi:hypothetical protein